MSNFGETPKLIYPHEGIDVMHKNARGVYSSAYELMHFTHFISLQTLHIESQESRSNAFAVANGRIGANIFPNKKLFSDFINQLGYRAPRSVIIEPEGIERGLDYYSQVAALDERRPQRFCKPVNAARGRGARMLNTIEDTLAFITNRNEPYLVQTFERPERDWRYILHKDSNQLANYEQSGWHVMFKVVQPTVVGDGNKSIAVLVAEDELMPINSKQNYVMQHKNDLATVPDKDKVVQLVHTGNRAQGAYKIPHSKEEERNLDRFMAQFMSDLEAGLGTRMGTLCVDLGATDSMALSGEYDFEKIKGSIVFYEHQLPFGMKPYLKDIPSETIWSPTDNLIPRLFRKQYVEAQVYAGFVRSVIRSGKFLRDHKT
jgi:hypothetical protein